MATILIVCFIFSPFLNWIPRKCNVRSELVRCCMHALPYREPITPPWTTSKYCQNLDSSPTPVSSVSLIIQFLSKCREVACPSLVPDLLLFGRQTVLPAWSFGSRNRRTTRLHCCYVSISLRDNREATCVFDWRSKQDASLRLTMCSS